ncbi:MAG: hypothetical protein QXR76_04460 [Candidatus Bathyarchaeia archaeon]
MYQIFEIKLRPKEIDLQQKLGEVNRLNWHLNCGKLVKDDDGLEYVLDFSNFRLICLVSNLFLVEEGKWSPKDYPAREEIVNAAMKELEKLPFNLEIVEVKRFVKNEK